MRIWLNSRVLSAMGVWLVGTALGGTTPAAATAPEKPADTMRDLRDHFSACFHPPRELAGSRVTFYFSIDANGQVVARPRTVLFGFKGTPADKEKYLSSFETSFTHCLPLAMSPQLATSIPGKVYFLQYVVAESGTTQEVLLRPFGSHGGGGGGLVQPGELGPDFVPSLSVVAPVRISPVPAYAMRPPIRPLFPQRRIFFRIPRAVPPRLR